MADMDEERMRNNSTQKVIKVDDQDDYNYKARESPGIQSYQTSAKQTKYAESPLTGKSRGIVNSRIEIVSSKRDNMEKRTNKGHDPMVTPQPLSPAAMSRLSALNTEAVSSTIQPVPPKAPLHKMVEVDKNLADHGEDLTLRYAQ